MSRIGLTIELMLILLPFSSVSSGVEEHGLNEGGDGAGERGGDKRGSCGGGCDGSKCSASIMSL